MNRSGVSHRGRGRVGRQRGQTGGDRCGQRRRIAECACRHHEGISETHTSRRVRLQGGSGSDLLLGRECTNRSRGIPGGSTLEESTAETCNVDPTLVAKFARSLLELKIKLWRAYSLERWHTKCMHGAFFHSS